MSTDFEDPQLGELLSRHARDWRAGFTAPSLDGMLDAATSRPTRLRWALPAAAAAVLLAIPVATVVILHRHGSDSRPAVRPAPAVTDGSRPVTERSLGALPWANAVLQADGKTLSVTVTQSAACGEPTPSARAVVATQTPTTVSIRVTGYIRSDAPSVSPAPGQTCSGSSGATYSLAPTVRLELNSRQLVDASTGRRHGVLDARSVPTAGFLPPGFTGGAVDWAEQATVPDPNYFERTYHNPIGTVSIRRSTYDPVSSELVASVPAGTVHGHPARYAAIPFVRSGGVTASTTGLSRRTPTTAPAGSSWTRRLCSGSPTGCADRVTGRK